MCGHVYREQWERRWERKRETCLCTDLRERCRERVAQLGFEDVRVRRRLAVALAPQPHVLLEGTEEAPLLEGDGVTSMRRLREASSLEVEYLGDELQEGRLDVRLLPRLG